MPKQAILLNIVVIVYIYITEEIFKSSALCEVSIISLICDNRYYHLPEVPGMGYY